MKKCRKCGNYYDLENNSWWDEKGLVSTKLSSCPSCGYVQIVKYGDYLLKTNTNKYNLNKDQRYY